MTDWPMTFRCNNNCVSCINNTALFSMREDPPMGQIKLVIDTIDPKSDYLGISGGEPTLRAELFDVLTYARQRHPDLYIFLVSNGRMFCYKEFAQKLASMNLGNYMIGIALYGPNKAIHDSITMAKGSFDQTIEGIENLLALGVPIEIRVIINSLNYMHLEETASFVVERFKGIKRMVFLNIKYTGNAYKNRDNVMVKLKDVVPHAIKAVDMIRNSKIPVKLYHFPLCTLPENLWPLAEGVTKTDPGELRFVDACEECSLMARCPRIWATYIGLYGEDEFIPVKR